MTSLLENDYNSFENIPFPTSLLVAVALGLSIFITLAVLKYFLKSTILKKQQGARTRREILPSYTPNDNIIEIAPPPPAYHTILIEKTSSSSSSNF
jgi:hypothetical protein